MAVTSSLGLAPKKKPCRSKICKACGLYLNQEEIYDERKPADVFWVGLSAVLFDEHEERLPLSPATASGALIHRIEEPFRSELSFYKTNLVKCVPLNENKIRYPLEHEMEKCFCNFEEELEELKPHTVFLLGKQVAAFVFKKLGLGKPSFNENFAFGFVEVGGIRYVPVHHPSYILVYKRRNLSEYVDSIQGLFPITRSSDQPFFRHPESCTGYAAVAGYKE